MSRTEDHDIEQGQEEGFEETALPGGVAAQSQHDGRPEIGINDPSASSELSGSEEPSEHRRDFDDSADGLWTLYGKEARGHGEEWIKVLKEDIDTILIFAGLFSAVLTAFVVPKIQDLKMDPADQSAYYQNQTVHMLDRISQQFASVDRQISSNYTPPLPYPTFHPSASDRRVNIFWLISLVCSLSASLLATLVQQWARVYMRVFRQPRSPMKTARIRLFLFEGAHHLPSVVEFIPGLIHISIILFLWGLGDIILHTDKTVFIATVVPILVCVCLYLYCVFAPIWNPQSPYWTPFSPFFWHLIQILHRNIYYCFRGKLVSPASIELRQEISAMKPTKSRMGRDIRAVQWLIERIKDSDEMEAFVLAIPGSFEQEWGRSVWKGVVGGGQSTFNANFQLQPLPGHPLEFTRDGSAVYELCRCVRNFFNAYNIEGDFMDTMERQRCIRGCVETAASLVCCSRVELGLFGKVLSKVLRKVGDKERTNDPLTMISNPLFTVRWTCLSLVAIWKMLDVNTLQELTKFALDGFARLHTESGVPDTMALIGVAQRIDGYQTKAWAAVVDLYLAFDSQPWSMNRTESDIINILNNCEESISELEGIANEAVDVEDVDRRISFFQERMDGITHALMQRLPGVTINKLNSAASILISEAFDFPSVGTTIIPPPFIFPGQQIQSLCTLGRRLRDIIEGQNTERREETLKSLESLREIPIALPHRLDYSMKRQLWRLLDLRDGRGFGFTVELFFLAVRQLELSSASSSSELMLTKVFYTGTFEAITSNWEKSIKSAGTQQILLDLLCDLVIGGRGLFSDFSYPPYIVAMLLDLVGRMVEGHGDLDPLINEVIEELEDDSLRNRMDNTLRDQALVAIG